MSNASTNSARKRGRPLDTNHSPRAHTTPPPQRPHSTRRSPAVLLPRRPESHTIATAPTAPNSGTDGVLALLDQSLAGAAPNSVAARHHILIVEDDSQVASVIRAGIELEGEADWAVQSAAEGRSALEIAGATPPDVVLLDVRLPGIGGAEVYRRLRASQKTRGARILFLSAGTAFDLHQLGIEDGVLLRKPFDVRNVVGLVRALLQG